MSTTTIYHNPRCSKSRQCLALLQEQGIEPKVIEYLKQPPDAVTLAGILRMLGLKPIELIRKQESPYSELGLAGKADDDQALIAAMCENPILIERPIVICGKQARLGRPPENVLELY